MTPLFKTTRSTLVDFGGALIASDGVGWVMVHEDASRPIRVMPGEALVMELSIDENNIATFIVSRREKT